MFQNSTSARKIGPLMQNSEALRSTAAAQPSFLGVEVKNSMLLVMTEQGIHVVALCQDVPGPTAQHCKLQKICSIFGFVLHKGCAGEILQTLGIFVRMQQFVIELPVLAGRPSVTHRTSAVQT